MNIGPWFFNGDVADSIIKVCRVSILKCKDQIETKKS